MLQMQFKFDFSVWRDPRISHINLSQRLFHYMLDYVAAIYTCNIIKLNLEVRTIRIYSIHNFSIALLFIAINDISRTV